MNNTTYSYPIAMTQQFRFCPNSFRIDMYKGCDFGCLYCFANSNKSKNYGGFGIAKLNAIENLFSKAFDSNEETKNITIELLRHKVPLHCGGMSDPFQTREWNIGLTKNLIELSNKYDYPISFSTKTAHLPDDYFEILNPKLHAFQVSIMGWDNDYIKQYEMNTPTAKERLDFVKKLRDKGFWCSIRIQPCVNIEQAKKLVINAGSIPSYITIEHLKIPNDNLEVKKLFSTEYQSTKFYKSPNNFRNIEMYPNVKEENIRAIKEIANSNGVLIGVGDNDLHHLSQSRCCCGIDLAGEAFQNYLKYNLTYMITGDCNPSELWCPQCNCRDIFNSTIHQGEKYLSYKDMVNEYLTKYDNLILNSEHPEIQRKIFKINRKKLF